MTKHVVGVHDWKELPRGSNNCEEVAIEQADGQEYENLTDGAGKTPDHALGEKLGWLHNSCVSIVSCLHNADQVHAKTKHQSYNIIGEHARVGIIPFASFVLFISLCLGQPIKSQAHSNKHHTLSEAWVRIFTLLGEDLLDVEDHEAQSNEEGDDELFWLWSVNASKCSN